MFSRCHLLPLLRRAVLIREFLVSLLFLPLLLPAQAVAPSWWAQRGVIVSGKTSDDYAAINQGQLKYLVSAAVEEMNAKLTGGAGSTLNSVVNAWTTNTTGADDFAVVTVGQLKSVAKPVYERLLAVGAIPQLPAWVGMNGSDDFAVANIGQAKHLFAFELTVPGSNDLIVPAGWEGSEWTARALDIIGSTAPPNPLSVGQVKDFYLTVYVPPNPNYFPRIERRHAYYMGNKFSWGGADMELYNERNEGADFLDGTPGTGIVHNQEPVRDLSTLSNEWSSVHGYANAYSSNQDFRENFVAKLGSGIV